MMNSNFHALIRFVSVLFLLSVSTVNFAQTKLRLWNIHGDGYPVTEALKSFSEAIKKTTNSRYEVELFNNGSLGDQPKAVAMVKSGELDLAEFSSGPLSEFAPGLKATNLPFLFRNTAHMFSHLDGALGEQYAQRLDAAGFHLLGWYDGGARSFYCVDRPVSNTRDLENTKIRVQNSEVYLSLIKNLGATPVSLPFKDVMKALENKQIDCAENNMPSYESTGHYKVAKNVFITNHVISPEALVISSKAWRSLSESDKAIFTKAGKESALLMRQLWQKRVAEAVALTSKAGSNFVYLKDAQSMVRRNAPLYKKFMDDPTTRNELLTILAN